MEKTASSYPSRASNAENHSSPKSLPECFVADSVASSPVTLRERQPVYNLLVEDCHEYFANGILVHNCAFGTETAHDDQVDAFSGAFEALSAAGRDWNANDWNKVFAGTEQQQIEEVESGIERRLLAGLIE